VSKNGKQKRRIGCVASRDGDMRRKLVGWREGVEKYKVGFHPRNTPTGTESQRAAAPSKINSLMQRARA
jgi:hypothetical protein